MVRFCRMRFFVAHAVCIRQNCIQLASYNIVCGYDCRRVLKHVLKSYDIFRVVCVCRKDVVIDLHDEIPFCSHGVSMSHAIILGKIVPSKLPLNYV